MAKEDHLRFVPSAVDGLSSVSEVILFSDRLEALSEDRLVVIRFLDIARWYRIGGYFHRLFARWGWGVYGWPSVADRDWFHPPAERFFRFFTNPPITIYLPDESSETPYAQTIFRRVQDIIALDGFGTQDLG